MVVIGLAIELFAFGISFIISYREIERLRSVNLALARQIQDVAKRLGSRESRLFSFGFPDKTKSCPKGSALILFNDGNTEAKNFAGGLWSDLQSAGWKVHDPAPITPKLLSAITPPDVGDFTVAKDDVRLYAAQQQATVCSRQIGPNTPAMCLEQSLNACSIFSSCFGGAGFPMDDTIIIIVGTGP
jgi:hypothetical protein